jgi:hypothetical protein
MFVPLVGPPPAPPARSDSVALMANRPRKHLDAPALFEDLDLEDPQERAVSDEKPGLDRLVTKVSSPPKSWAMKWRPDEKRSIDGSDHDRHPARAAGVVSEASTDDEPEIVAADLAVNGPSETADERSATKTPIQSDPVLTSRTWDARSDAGARHPQFPSATPQPTSTPGVRTPATPMRSTTVIGRRRALSRAGWPLAIMLAIVWVGTGLFGPDPDGPSAMERKTSTTPEGETTILARPTEAELIDAELLRSELASMRDERARLMREVDAAYVLLQDHRRLSRELQESMATNKGASIEVDGLAEDLERWQRRHAVALERLDEMDEELLRSDEEIAALVAERDALKRHLDALQATD